MPQKNRMFILKHPMSSPISLLCLLPASQHVSLLTSWSFSTHWVRSTLWPMQGRRATHCDIRPLHPPEANSGQQLLSQGLDVTSPSPTHTGILAGLIVCISCTCCCSCRIHVCNIPVMTGNTIEALLYWSQRHGGRGALWMSLLRMDTPSLLFSVLCPVVSLCNHHLLTNKSVSDEGWELQHSVGTNINIQGTVYYYVPSVKE